MSQVDSNVPLDPLQGVKRCVCRTVYNGAAVRSKLIFCLMARMADDAQPLHVRRETCIHAQEVDLSTSKDKTFKQVMSLVKYRSVFTGG